MNRELGDYLLYHKNRNGLSFNEIRDKINGLKIDYSRCYLYQVFNGRVKKPDADLLYALSIVLSMDAYQVFTKAGCILISKVFG